MRYADLAVVQVDPRTLIPHPRRNEAGERYDTDEAYENLPAHLVALQANIMENGIREPLLVQAGTNILLTGHFRREVAIRAEWETVPCQALDVGDDEAYMIMMTDNWERNSAIMDDPMAIAKNMSYVAYRLKIETEDYQSRVRKGEISTFSNEVIGKVAENFNKSRATVYKYFQLLSLVDALQQWVSNAKMSMEAALSLCNKPEDVQRAFAIDFTDSKKITVADVKSYLKVVAPPQAKPDQQEEAAKHVEYGDIEHDDRLDDVIDDTDTINQEEHAENGEYTSEQAEHIERVDDVELVGHENQTEQRAILDDPEHMRQVELAKLELYMQKQTGVLNRIAKELAKRHGEIAAEHGEMAHMSEDAANLRTAAVELASAAGKFL